MSATGPFQHSDVLDMCLTGRLPMGEMQAQLKVSTDRHEKGDMQDALQCGVQHVLP